MRTTFQTTDPDLAAYLYARSYSVLGVWNLNKSTLFTFPAEAALSAEAFYAGATIPAKNLFQAVRHLEIIRRERISGHVIA